MENNVIRPFGDSEIEKHAAVCGGKRNLREVVVETEDGISYHYLLRKPSRGVVQAVASYSKNKAAVDIEGVQKVMMGCVLEGDKDAYEQDGSIYTELLSSVSNLLEGSKTTLKKL